MATTAKAAGTGNQVIGKVFIIYGKVKAVAPDGTVRVLGPNSPIYANERIVTEGDGNVSLMLDGPPPVQIDLGRMSDVLLNEDVYAGATPAVVADASADATKIQEALLGGDQPIELDATAAGGAGDSGGGHPIVSFDLDGSEVTPTSGADTQAVTFGAADTTPGVFADAPDGIPTAGEITATTLDDEGLEGGIAGGIGDVDGEQTSTSGILPHDFGPDGAGSIGFASMDGATGQLGVEEVTYSWDPETNTLTASSERGDIFTVEVDPATGAYTLTLLQNVLHEPGQGENDAVVDLTYTVTDSNGTSVNGTFNITIDDDTPVIAAGGEDYYTDATNGSGITTTLEVEAGDVITFSWSFDADDYTPFNDFGFVVIDGVATKLADISQVGDYNATGWATFTYIATADGPLTIGFGVMNTGDTSMSSNLLIDKLAVNGIVVGSFESGDLSGWASTGAVQVVTSHDEGGGTPTDGAYMVQLTSSGANEGALESFFGLPDGAMDAVSNTGLAEGGSDAVTVEDEKMDGGIDENDGGVAYVTGTIVDNVAWGADGFGEATTFSVGEDTFDANSTVYWDQYGQFMGRPETQPTDAAASLVVNSDGTYTFTLLDNMLISGEDEQTDLLATVSITGVDGDGDPVTVNVKLQVQDDVPMLMTGGEDSQLYSSDIATVEDEQAFGGINETETPIDGVKVVNGTIEDNVNWGADGFGEATGFAVGQANFAAGTTVYWAQDGAFLGTNVGEDSVQPAASLVVRADGTYTYELLDNMLLGQGIQGEQADLLATVSITGADADGDTVSVGLTLQVTDDIPEVIQVEVGDGEFAASADIATVEDEQAFGGIDETETPIDGVKVVNGTIEDNVNWGADGFGGVTGFAVGQANFAAGTTVYWAQDGAFLGTNVGEDSVQPAASLVVRADGTYTYELLDNLLLGQGIQGEQADLLATVSITGADADGDTVSVGLTLEVTDDIPEVIQVEVGDGEFAASADIATVEDEQAFGGIDETETPIDGVKVVNGTIEDNVNWGADGFGEATGFAVGQANFAAGTTVYWAQDGAFLGTNVGEDSVQPAASLVVRADGTYTYELLDNMLLGQGIQGEQADLLATVSITGADADGDTVSVGLTLQVTDDIPEVIQVEVGDGEFAASADIATVEDEQAFGGIDETETPIDGVKVVNGTIEDNVNWGADGFGGVTGFAVGQANFAAGATVYWAQDGGFLGTTSTGAAASLVVRADGTYTYELLDNLLLGQGIQGEQTDLLATVSITGADADGDTVSVGLTLEVTDDIPTAAPVNNEVLEGSAPGTNLMIILDVSGSMDENPNVSGFATRLAVAKDAINKLINEYDDMGDVAVRLVTFNANASASGSVWMTATQAKAVITAMSDNYGNGYTDYDAALAVAQTAFASAGKITGGQNISYFLSDGVPTDGDESIGITPGEETAWENFLNANDIKSYALGMGADANLGNLQPISYDGISSQEMQAVIVNLADLSGVLSETATVPATGELLTGAIFGADGPGALKIVSIAHDADGDPGTPDAVYDTSSAGYNAATKTLTITTHEGGTLSVNFETGAYNYIAPENVAQDTPEVFKYTIQDADGDTATANLTITVLDGVPAAAPDTATAAEGYWKTGGNVTYTDTITVPASWSAGTSEHDVDGKWEIDPSYWLGSTVKTISTPTFSLNADAGHPTSVSVYLHVQGYQSGDWVKVELINNSGTVIDTVWGPASNPNVTFSGITQSGTYYLKLSGDDNSSNGNLYAYIKDVSYDSYTYTPETSIPISVTAPDLAWQAAVAATGNVISNDAPGTDGGLVVTEVDGITVTAGGVDITGDYGTLHIHPDGSFTYTPSASDLPSGSSDEFSYTIQDADGSPSIATLTVNITDHAYSTTGGSGSDYLQGTSGNDTLTGNAGNDYLSGGDGNDILVGGTGNDHLVGGSGDDNLSGGDGTDILEGGAGIDILSGGAGSDYLSGGDGNDTLAGGTGNDILAGGTGADTFVFSEKGSANMDLILDYSAGDKIDLSSLINIATGKTVADYVKVEQIGSDVKVSVNTAGSGSDWSPVAILDGYGTGGTDLVKVLIDGNEHEFNV